MKTKKTEPKRRDCRVNALLQFIDKNGIAQKFVAEKAGVSESFFSQIATGTRPPPSGFFETLNKNLAGFFNFQIEVGGVKDTNKGALSSAITISKEEYDRLKIIEGRIQELEKNDKWQKERIETTLKKCEDFCNQTSGSLFPAPDKDIGDNLKSKAIAAGATV